MSKLLYLCDLLFTIRDEVVAAGIFVSCRNLILRIFPTGFYCLHPGGDRFTLVVWYIRDTCGVVTGLHVGWGISETRAYRHHIHWVMCRTMGVRAVHNFIFVKGKQQVFLLSQVIRLG